MSHIFNELITVNDRCKLGLSNIFIDGDMTIIQPRPHVCVSIHLKIYLKAKIFVFKELSTFLKQLIRGGSRKYTQQNKMFKQVLQFAKILWNCVININGRLIVNLQMIYQKINKAFTHMWRTFTTYLANVQLIIYI